MSRETWVLLDGKFICKARNGDITPEYVKAYGEKLSGKKINCISDKMGNDVNGLKSMADGKMYDSKSRYYQSLKDKGCYVVGNEYNNKQFKRPPVRGDFNVRPQLKQAIDRVLSNRG